MNSVLFTCTNTVCIFRTANTQVLEDVCLKHYRLYRRLIQSLISSYTASVQVGSSSSLCSCEVIYLRLFLNLLGTLKPIHVRYLQAAAPP